MTNPKQNQGRGPYGDTKPNQSQLLITEAELRDIKATIDPKDRKWTDLGGDLEGSYDKVKYVDIRIKGSETTRLFISRGALVKALGLFSESRSELALDFVNSFAAEHEDDPDARQDLYEALLSIVMESLLVMSGTETVFRELMDAFVQQAVEGRRELESTA